ncbi:hypothetical protein TWF696_007922 [Orbilia brochopaga]|uniref:F-box domain-containing protein n=1 Tax=Orbilia brochopaga TaxID=3140254 RepID=A0AAV9ULZ0_9PEZI
MAKKSLQDLPAEILLAIFKNARHSKRQMAKLCLVSKTLNAIVTPMLYETVILTFDRIYGSQVNNFQSLAMPGNRGVPYIRNFGIRGKTLLWDSTITVEYPSYAPETRSPLDEDWHDVLWQLCNFSIMSIVQNFRKNQLRSFIWNMDLDVDQALARLLISEQQALTGLWVQEGESDFDWSCRKLYTYCLENSRQMHLHNVDYVQWAGHFASFAIKSLPQLYEFTFSPGCDFFEDVLEQMSKEKQDYGLHIALEALGRRVIGPNYYASRLRYLCLSNVCDRWFTSWMPLTKIIETMNLTVLKLYDCEKLKVTLGDLAQQTLRLKVFHFSGIFDREPLATFIDAFDGLEELYIDILSNRAEYIELARAIKSHGETLEILFFRIGREVGGIKRICNDSLDILINHCPRLRQLAILPDFDNAASNLGSHHKEFLRRMKLVWLLMPPLERVPIYTVLSDYLKPFHNSQIVSTPKPRFVAIGHRDDERKHGTLIFEIHEHETIAGHIRTSFNYLTHRQMYDACPDLTMLNTRTDWLPWEEYRDFIESKDISQLGEDYYH